MDWRNTVNTMGERVFPGLFTQYKEQLEVKEVMTNLPLQMSLYFNVTFFTVWILIFTHFFYQQIGSYKDVNRYIVVILFVIIITLEVLRLYLGYVGNLYDKIPELAGFWLFSLLLQLPLQGFLLFNPYFGFSVLELIPQTVMFCLLSTQLIFGYFSLKYTTKQQTLYYKIMKLSKSTNIEELQNKYKEY